MNVIDTLLPGVKIIEPTVFKDERGSFSETYNHREFCESVGDGIQFVQDNQSQSTRGVLRGLHLQLRKPQGKLVRVTAGEIFDVAVDCRLDSATFSQWIGVPLVAESFRQLWIPAGFAHGFLTLSDYAEVQYKVTDYYDPGHELTLAWNDTQVGIEWPSDSQPLLSPKDTLGLNLQAVTQKLERFV